MKRYEPFIDAARPALRARGFGVPAGRPLADDDIHRICQVQVFR